VCPIPSSKLADKRIMMKKDREYVSGVGCGWFLDFWRMGNWGEWEIGRLFALLSPLRRMG